MFRSCVAPHFATRSSRNADEKSCPCHAQRQPLDIARGARLWRRRSVAALIRHILNRHVVRAAARGRHGTWTTEIASAAYSSTYLAPSPCQPLGAGQNDGLVERHRRIIYYLVLSPLSWTQRTSNSGLPRKCVSRSFKRKFSCIQFELFRREKRKVGDGTARDPQREGRGKGRQGKRRNEKKKEMMG